MSTCLICRIVAREIPADIVFENDGVIAFRDIDPQAPVHVLVAPRRHIGDLTNLDSSIGGALLAACSKVASDQGIAASGFRAVVNTGVDGGQSVDHLHVHVLGGRAMAWPPG